MSSRTVAQNLWSGAIAGVVALVIYTAIASFFFKGLTTPIFRTGLMYGVATFAVTFLLSYIISQTKAKQP